MKKTAVAPLLCVLFAGCADDELVPPKDDPCPAPDKAMCAPGGGADEVGDGDGDAGDGSEYYPCTTETGFGVKTMHQCNGHLTASIDFTVIAEVIDLKKSCTELLGVGACSQTWEFGIGFDDYNMPAVMACCDVDGSSEDDLLTYCAADLVEQVCASIPARLQAVLEQGFGDLPNIAKAEVMKQAKNLLTFLNQEQQACVDALSKQGSPGIITSQTWLVNGGGNGKWPALHGFAVTIDKATVLSTSLPEAATDWLGCEGSQLNDGEVFEEPGPVSPVLGVDAYRPRGGGSVPVEGRRSAGDVIASGSATMAAHSELVMGESDNHLVIEDLALYADGFASFAFGEIPLEVDGLSMRLYGFIEARPLHVNDGRVYAVEPGAAHFIVRGSVGDVAGMRWASNTTPIRLHANDDGWEVGAFTVEHVDGLGQVWRALVPSMVWE